MHFRRFLLLCLYTTLLRWGMIFCVYIKTNFFPLPQEVTTIFSVIPLQLCHLNHQRMRLVWRQMHCYFHFFFLLSYARRGAMPSAYTAIAVESPCVVSSSDFMDHLKYKDLLVTSCSCWYMLILMICIMKKCLPIYCIEGNWCVYH